METVLKAIADWIKGILTAGIMSNLSGLFDDVNTQVGNIAQQVGTKPSSFEPRVFAMIEALSRNVVLPIAGIILTFIACYELIEMITQHNNMAQFEPALIMRWIKVIQKVNIPALRLEPGYFSYFTLHRKLARKASPRTLQNLLGLGCWLSEKFYIIFCWFCNGIV